jgi:hypothetical protein
MMLSDEPQARSPRYGHAGAGKGTETPAADRITARLDTLEARLRKQLEDEARVEHELISGVTTSRVSMVSITPRRPDALAVGWLEMGDSEIIFHAGHIGGRWELGHTDADVDLVEDLIESVVAGRVVEIFAPRRSQVRITLADGQIERETGLNGCLTLFAPLPGWKRLGRHVYYHAYS